MAVVTAILMSYERKANMPQIVESYRNQSIPVEIWMINNNGDEHFGADKLISIPWNAGEMARYIWCARPETGHVCFQDDDFVMRDSTFLETAVDLVEQRPDFFVGTAGRNINWEGDYPTAGHYAPEAKKDQGAAILKGHFQCFRKELATKVHIMGHFSASDIWWSLDISQGAPSHFVSADLCSRLKTLDRHGVGLEFRPRHWPERSGVVKEWIDRNNKPAYWWNEGVRPDEYGLYTP